MVKFQTIMCNYFRWSPNIGPTMRCLRCLRCIAQDFIKPFRPILRDVKDKQLTFVGWPLLTRSSASWPACQSWGLSWSLTWNNLSSSDRLKTFGHFSSQTGVGTALACIGSHTATASASSFCLTAHTFPPTMPPLWSLAISKLRAT